MARSRAQHAADDSNLPLPEQQQLHQDREWLIQQVRQREVEKQNLEKQVQDLAQARDQQNAFLQNLGKAMQTVQASPIRIVQTENNSNKDQPLHPYKIGLDWDVFVRSFLERAAFNRWSDDMIASKLRFSLDQKAMETAVHADPTILDDFDGRSLLNKLKAIFGKAFKEGDAVARFDTRQQQVGESYQDYMLDLRCLYNLAWPGEAPSTKDAKLIYKFVHTIKDRKMSEYLWDKDCTTPAEAVRAAERKRCGQSGLDRAHAMIDPSKMADSAGTYAYYQGQRAGPNQAKPFQQGPPPSNTNAEKRPMQSPDKAANDATGPGYHFGGTHPQQGTPSNSNARRNKRRRNRGKNQPQAPNSTAPQPAASGQAQPAFPIFGSDQAAPPQPPPAFPVFGPMPDLSTPPPPLPQAPAASGYRPPTSGN